MRKLLFHKAIPSVFLVFICYLCIYTTKLARSVFFSLPELLFTVLLFAIIQYLIARMFMSGRAWMLWTAVAIYLAAVAFFFTLSTIDAVNLWQQEHLASQYVRGSVSFALLFLILMAASILTARRGGFIVQNVFLAIFSLVSLLGSIWRGQDHFTDLHTLHPHIKPVPPNDSGSLPVVLIVLDEYASPDECVKVSRDSSSYFFSQQLANRGWIVNNHMNSYEASTIHSLASAFNFNLSEGGGFSKASFFDISTEMLMRNALYDSLHAKGVQVVNWGILDLGKEKSLQRLYYYPRNFVELLARYTLLYYLLSGDPVSYNQRVVQQAPAKFAELPPRSFMYLHLFMPHAPFHFGPSFPRVPVTTDAYLRFRLFTEKKMIEMIDHSFARGKFRVIITGDHGYREDSRFNPYSTFTAFLGFSEAQASAVKSVQDLGSLVNAEFYPEK